MAKNFRITLNDELKDPVFKKEYSALEPEYQVVRALLDVRKERSLAQGFVAIGKL